jgi:mannose-1-phosphate guanylyltransferase
MPTERTGDVEGLYAVIPAGGAGTRLWPVSRAASPKFLHDLTGSGRSLLQGTVDRLTPLVGDRAAIGLAAAVIERVDPDAVMGSFAADHVIADEQAFADAVRRAAAAARDDWLVTLGVEPTHASTAFGYIHLGDALPGHAGVHRVVEFVEKPAADEAAGYLETGSYRWNAGMFVVRPRVLLDLLEESHPGFAGALRAIAADRSRLEELWDDLPRIAIDHAVAEPAAAAGRVAVVPAAIGWDDVGDYDSLATLLAADGEPVTVLGDASLVRVVDSFGLVVPGSGRVVAVVGLDDVVVVDTPDALLVTTRARAQDVKRVVTALQEDGQAGLT